MYHSVRMSTFVTTLGLNKYYNAINKQSLLSLLTFP